MNGASRTGQIGGISDRGSSPRLYQARIANILQREGSTTFIATLVNPPTYFRPSQCTSSLSGQLTGLKINDIVSVSINPTGSFLFQGVVKKNEPLPLQSAAASQEATPAAATPKLTTPAELLSEGGRLRKQVNRNLGHLSDELKSQIEKWITNTQKAIPTYQAELGSDKWTKKLIDQQVTLVGLIEVLNILQVKLGITPTRIDLPCYIAVEPTPKPQPRAVPVDRKPASAPKPDISPRSISGKTWGMQFTVAGILGKFVEVYGEEADQFLPNQLSHSSLLDYGNFVYTGITILGYERPLKVYCTKEFLENAAPLLLKAIAEGQIFHHNDSFYFGLEEEFIFGNRCFGCYSPQGVMHSDLFKTQHQAHGNGFPFRLTIEGFSKEWTVRDLIRAMAQRSLRAVGVEKAEVVPTEPAKPERPTICQTDRDLISVISTIRSVNWEFENGDINRNEAVEQIAIFNNSSVTSWLDYLDSDPKHLVREYDYQLEGWRANLRDAIKILAFFRDYTNQ